jgi:NADH dehydrogenase FAD-containing subunit
MIGLNLWQKPQQIAVAAALCASQIMRAKLPQAKLREPSYASQGILSGCSREHAVVKANLGTCLSAATVLYLFRTAHELAAQPEAVGHGAFVIAG